MLLASFRGKVVLRRVSLSNKPGGILLSKIKKSDNKDTYRALVRVGREGHPKREE